MNKKNNNKGFTLAELLIVVAIIAVLVAIAIPVFTSQLEKSREATDLANVRSAYAQLITNYLDNGTAQSITVDATQTQDDWQSSVDKTAGGNAIIGTDFTSKLSSAAAGSSGTASGTKLEVPAKTDTYTITIDDTGKVSCT